MLFRDSIDFSASALRCTVRAEPFFVFVSSIVRRSRSTWDCGVRSGSGFRPKYFPNDFALAFVASIVLVMRDESEHVIDQFPTT